MLSIVRTPLKGVQAHNRLELLPLRAVAQKVGSNEQSRSCTTRATIRPGSTSNTQVFVAGNIEAEAPVAAVQKLPVEQQTAVFFAIFTGLVAGAAALCSNTDLSWASGAASPYIFGIIFTAGAFKGKFVGT